MFFFFLYWYFFKKKLWDIYDVIVYIWQILQFLTIEVCKYVVKRQFDSRLYNPYVRSAVIDMKSRRIC